MTVSCGLDPLARPAARPILVKQCNCLLRVAKCTICHVGRVESHMGSMLGLGQIATASVSGFRTADALFARRH